MHRIATMHLMQKSSTHAITVGEESAPNRVLIIHGYTGGPDEFLDLATVLSTRLNAQAHVPLLPGHGTSEEDLLNFSFDDLLKAATQHAQKSREAGGYFFMVGHSLGAHLALLAATEFSPTAAALTVMPYHLRPPFSIPGMELYAKSKTFWDKQLSPQELEDRKDQCYYPRMPGIALEMLKNANRRVEKIIKQITVPLITIHNYEDPTCYASGGEELLRLSGKNPHNTAIILNRKEHGLFYGEGKEDPVERIANFFESVLKRM